jgi:hypothetical protein
VATRILQGNAAGQGIAIKLQAVGIGDGWVDPITQYRSFPVFGYERGLIDEHTYATLNKTADLCAALIVAGLYDLAWIGMVLVIMVGWLVGCGLLKSMRHCVCTMSRMRIDHAAGCRRWCNRQSNRNRQCMALACNGGCALVF